MWVDGHVGGESERIIGEWMLGWRRSSLTIATKVGKLPGVRGLAPDVVRRAIDASLERLGMDYVDIYYAHADDPDVPLETVVRAFDGLVREGLVRRVGLSNFTADRVREWLDISDREGLVAPSVLQPHYNLVFRKEFESGLREVALEMGLIAMPYFGLASGFLTGKYRTAANLAGRAREVMAGRYLNAQAWSLLDEVVRIAGVHQVEPATVALAWLLAQPTVFAPIASVSHAAQLPAMMAARLLTLSEEEAVALGLGSARVEA